MNLLHGLLEHECRLIERRILLPLRVEAYNSKEIVTAKCNVCGETVLDRTIDRAAPASKGFYMTV